MLYFAIQTPSEALKAYLKTCNFLHIRLTTNPPFWRVLYMKSKCLDEALKAYLKHIYGPRLDNRLKTVFRIQMSSLLPEIITGYNAFPSAYLVVIVLKEANP